MVLNTLKTKVMLITSRQKRNNLHESALSLKYNDIDIKMTTSDTILGVHVDENLSWNDHYRHVSKKVSSYLWGPQGFWGSGEKGYLFSGSWGALLIILGELGSKHILLGI